MQFGTARAREVERNESSQSNERVIDAITLAASSGRMRFQPGPQCFGSNCQIRRRLEHLNGQTDASETAPLFRGQNGGPRHAFPLSRSFTMHAPVFAPLSCILPSCVLSHRCAPPTIISRPFISESRSTWPVSAQNPFAMYARLFHPHQGRR